MKRLKRKSLNSGGIFPYLLVSIGVIHFLVFFVYVNANTFVLAFTRTTADGDSFSFYYFESLFSELALSGSVMISAMLNTFKYWTLTIVKLFLSFFIAYFFYKKVPLHGLYRVIFFLPSMLPGIIVITVFKNFITTYGPLWSILNDVFNYELPVLLSESATATNTILFFVLWSGFGVQMLIFVGALNRLPESVLEAATLDGCNWTKEFRYIIIPFAWETLSIYLILAIGGLFMASGPILYFSGTKAQYNNTYTIDYWIYDKVIGGQLNYTAAVGLFFSVLSVPLALLSRWLLSRANKDLTF